MSCGCTGSRPVAVVRPSVQSSVSSCGCPSVNRGFSAPTPSVPYNLPSIVSHGAVVVPRRCDAQMVAPIPRSGSSMDYPSISAKGCGCQR
jgi:hypothetical protein